MHKRYIGIIIFIFLVWAGLMSGGLYLNNRSEKALGKTLTNNYTAIEKTSSDAVAASLVSRVENIKNSLYAISFDPEVQSGSTSVCNAALLKYQSKLNLGVSNLGRVGSDGRFRCSINTALVGVPASKLGNYLDPLFQDPTHPAVVSRHLIVPKVQGYVVAVHVPVYNSRHEFIGSVGGAIYLDKLADEYLSKIKFAKTGFVGLHDDNGDILYSGIKEFIGKNVFSPELQAKLGNNKSYNMAVRSGYNGKSSVAYFDLNGVHRVASISPVNLVPGHRWATIVVVPTNEIADIYVRSGLTAAFSVVAWVYGIGISLAALLLLLLTIASYRLQRSKDEFVSLASHQLINPAAAVKQYLELLSMASKDKLSDKAKEYLDTAKQSNERQIEVINTLLNVSRIDLGHFVIKKEQIDLTPLVTAVLKEQSPDAARSKIQIDPQLPSKPVEALIDATAFKMIVDNLVSNAIKYTQPHKSVSITLSQTHQDVTLSVRDEGVGIAKKDQRKLFKKFSRISNKMSQTSKGNGLGLYLVKSLVNIHHGQITVESRPGHGTTFTVTIPKNS